MQIRSTRFGVVEVDAERILTFPRGLVGFSRFTRFALLPHGDGSPFWILHSADDPDLAFVVMDPREVDPGYVARVAAAELADIGVQTAEDAEAAVVLAIVTIPADPRRATANLRAPLIINPASRRGVQVILEGSPYAIRHPLFPAEGRTAGGVEAAAGGSRLAVTGAR